MSDLLKQKDAPYTWVTGEVELVTRSDGSVSGKLKGADGESVVLRTVSGDCRVRFADVVNVIYGLSSPGPE